jgi:hypothetical protein
VSAPTHDSKLDPGGPEGRGRAAPIRALALAAGIAVVCTTARPTLSAEGAARTTVSATDPVRAILARHDCCGRLANTAIVKVGDVRSGAHRLTVYDLWFVNPESRHGMRHVAIVEGRRFRGSYVIDSSVVPDVAGNRIRFMRAPPTEGECDASSCEDLVIKDGVLPPRLWTGGEVNDLGDSI